MDNIFASPASVSFGALSNIDGRTSHHSSSLITSSSDSSIADAATPRRPAKKVYRRVRRTPPPPSPFQIQLNLVLNVTPSKDAQGYAVEPAEVVLNNANLLPKKVTKSVAGTGRQTGVVGAKNVQKAPVINRRYKNIKSLLRSPAMKNVTPSRSRSASSRPKSHGSTFPGSLPLPRALNFDDADDVFEPNQSITKPMDKTVTFASSSNKLIQNDEAKSSTKTGETQNSQLSDSPVVVAVVSGSGRDSVQGIANLADLKPTSSDTTPNEKPKSEGVSVSAQSKPQPRASSFNESTLTTGNNDTFQTLKDADPSPSKSQGHYVNVADNSYQERPSFASTVSFSDYVRDDGIVHDLQVIKDLSLFNSTEAVPLTTHVRHFRIGLNANGQHMAVPLTLYVRTDEAALFLEPIEFLVEGTKIWRRSDRQVAKEMEAKLAAVDKFKKNGSNATSSASNSSVTSPAKVAVHKSHQAKKAAAKGNVGAKMGTAETKK